MRDRVLVAGIGNIFLGDDGWGVEVANRLARREVPRGVRVADFGIRGVHLAYELLDGYDALVLVDAMPMGEAPGTVAVVRPDRPCAPRPGDDAAMIDAHSMNPGVVLALIAGLDATVEQILVIGCEPASFEEGIGLSPDVADAVERGVEACLEVLVEIMGPVAKETTG